MSDSSGNNVSSSGGGAGNDCDNITATVTLSRESIGKGSAPEKKAPPPPAEIAKMPHVKVNSRREVLCPKCNDCYEDISAAYYNTVTECLKCHTYFVIRSPGFIPSPKSSPGFKAQRGSPTKKTTTSGIEVGATKKDAYNVTGTVLLKRSSMGMKQTQRGAKKQRRTVPSSAVPSASGRIPPSASPRDSEKKTFSVATETDVGCPKCKGRFGISSEFYGCLAECPDCGCEFIIKPPGSTANQQSASPVPQKTSMTTDVPKEEVASEKNNKTVVTLLITVSILVVILIVVAVIILLRLKK